ncbi:GDSL-type esterase/lipase family protein [Terrilactibacillus sp. S3-3]|nr:GDSL-type esterase/lipase family protein [Terrilactibacillus sp. S3-3]
MSATKKNKGYVGTTVDRLKQKKNNVKKVAFVDFGHRGDTSSDLLQVLKRASVKQQIKKSNVVFLTIGANDLVHVLRTHFLDLKAVYFTEQEHVFNANFNEILEEIRKLNPKTTIYYFGLYNPFEDYMGSSNNKLVDTLKEWNRQSEVTLKKYPQTTFIPTYDIFYGKKRYPFI